MARYLLANNRVQFLRPDQTLSYGTIFRHGAWVDGEGIWVGCCDNSYFKEYLAILHLDGVLTPIGQFKYGMPLLYKFHQITGSSAENWIGCSYELGMSFFQNHRRLMYQEYPDVARWMSCAYGGNLVRTGPTVYDTLILRAMGVSGEGYNWYVCQFTGEDPADAEECTNWLPVSPPLASAEDEPWTNNRYPGFSHAGENLYYCCFAQGRYALYDHGTRSVIHKDRWIDDFTSGSGFSRSHTVYAKELGVFLTLAWPDFEPADYLDAYKAPVYLRIYANEGDPTQLSSPTISPAPSVLARSRLETVVRGAQDDPVENAYVNWQLSGQGSLLYSQTVTDDHGVAENWYLGPSVYTAGQIEVSVSTDRSN